jgi:hypothetical protein
MFSVEAAEQVLQFFAIRMCFYSYFLCEYLSAVLLNDLHRFDVDSFTWTDLSSFVTGTAPPPREYHGVATLNGILYVFGGLGNSGETGSRNYMLLRIGAGIKCLLTIFCV